MIAFALVLMGIPAALLVYAYVGYPLLLLVGAPRARVASPPDPAEWPLVTVLIPAYNAERAIARTLDAVLASDYPRDRLHVLVVSDASTDGTDDIVRAYASRNVELLRQPRRGGKTAGENAAAPRLRGEIVVNTDATIVVAPTALKRLVRHFGDARVGIVSGRDVSVEGSASDTSRGEAKYSGYEMRVRSLESRHGLIAGATGSLYAVRRALHDPAMPLTLTRDFASTLAAYEAGWTTVAEDDATCLVARTPSLAAELARKARTMAHGIDTLFHFRRLLNPVRHGRFALMLLSHKLARWLVFPSLPLGLLGLAVLGAAWPWALLALVPALVAIGVGIAAVRLEAARRDGGAGLPGLVALCGFVVVAIAAALVAWKRFLARDHVLVWEPTRRAT